MISSGSTASLAIDSSVTEHGIDVVDVLAQTERLYASFSNNYYS